jgi:hypothetical protein
MKIKSTDFTSSNVNGVVSFKGKPVLVKTKLGWTTIPCSQTNVAKACGRAIFWKTNNISAGDLRRAVTDELEL